MNKPRGGVNLAYPNKTNSPFQLTNSFKLFQNINRIERLPAPIHRHSRDWIRMEEGYPMYSFWVYKQLEVDPQTENAIYEDVNEDGEITVADRQIAGNALPDFFGGITNRFNYL